MTPGERSRAKVPGRTSPWGIAWFIVAALGSLVALARLWIVNADRPALLASDLELGYLVGARRFLETGSPYLAEQVAGPWELGFHSFIHPPLAVLLMVPFLWLPTVLWWLIPIGLTAYCLWRLRPAPWTWAVMALLVCWPRSTGAILTGNTDLWAMAAVAGGAVWGWPIVGLAVKPTFAPIAVLAIRAPSAWVAGAVVGVAVALTLPLWLDWWAVIRHSGLPMTYSLLNLPLVLVPVVAWLGRFRVAVATATIEEDPMLSSRG